MAVLVSPPPPCVLFEDDHLLVVNKPPGLNTHAPSPYAGEGLHEWLKNREPRWANLAIVHRLDKVTSGLILFAKSKVANQSLTAQFATRAVRKRYLLLSEKRPRKEKFTARTLIARLGEKYFANEKSGESAETEFESVSHSNGYHLIAAYPHTGRTHQIRVHAAHFGFPIAGDELYGGAPFHRVCLHAEELELAHPVTGEKLQFRANANFETSVSAALRQAFIEPQLTNTFRLDHGEHAPGTYVERWGDYVLVEAEESPGFVVPALAGPLPYSIEREQNGNPGLQTWEARGTYYKRLNRQVQRASVAEASPQHLSGETAPDPFTILENGVRYEISFARGYSVGLFLDQRDNRRRLLTNHVAAGFPLPLAGKDVLNTFAYTCGFSVCAALGGARCTSLDLSKPYIEWGQRNFALNNLDPAAHDFIYGDVFDWIPRLHKKGRQFDLIILDPPTFSRSKIGGTFQAERDYGKLVKLVLPLLRSGGVLFASTNAHKMPPEDFRAEIHQACAKGNRKIAHEHYVPQPIDFPVSKEEPAYLKTIWVRLSAS